MNANDKDVGEPCPRCGGKSFGEHDRGPDSWEDDITYTSYSCDGCGLWYHGWFDVWQTEDDDSGGHVYAYQVGGCEPDPTPKPGFCDRLVMFTEFGPFEWFSEIDV